MSILKADIEAKKQKKEYDKEYGQRPYVKERRRTSPKRKEYMKKWHTENKERQKQNNKAYYKKNKEAIKRKVRVYQKKHAKEIKLKIIRRLYGLTPKQYHNLLEIQKYSCAGCGVPQAELNKPLFIDHAHPKGNVRGLLCMRCNMILGQADDNPEVLRRLIGYLEKSNVD